MHRDVNSLDLRAQKRRAKHDGDALRGHPVLLTMLYHSAHRQQNNITTDSRLNTCIKYLKLITDDAAE